MRGTKNLQRDEHCSYGEHSHQSHSIVQLRFNLSMYSDSPFLPYKFSLCRKTATIISATSGKSNYLRTKANGFASHFRAALTQVGGKWKPLHDWSGISNCVSVLTWRYIDYTSRNSCEFITSLLKCFQYAIHLIHLPTIHLSNPHNTTE